MPVNPIAGFDYLAFKRWMRRLSIATSILIVLILGYFLVGWPQNYPKEYGVTWSSPYAWGLGLNPNEGLRQVLDDLGVRQFRIPAYWTDIEREQGKYDFSILQEQLDEIGKRNGRVMLAIGARLPRWPECWVPDSAKRVDMKTREAMQMAYVQATYERFKNHPTIVAWQVENESQLKQFVKCEGLTKELVIKELRYVRGEEAKRGERKRPVITTDSGELSLWTSFAGETDGLGVSVYRSVTNPWLGIVRYWFIPPWAYARKAALVKWLTGPISVTEFQMEPWSEVPLPNTKPEDQYKTLSLQHMRANFTYAKQIDVPMIDFWGAEWWYWMKTKQNVPEFWDEARRFFAESRQR